MRHGNLLQDGKFSAEGVIEIVLLLQAAFKIVTGRVQKTVHPGSSGQMNLHIDR